MEKKRKHLNTKAKIFLILAIVLAGVSLTTGIITARQFYQREQARREFERLAAEMASSIGNKVEEESADSAAETEPEATGPEEVMTEAPYPTLSELGIPDPEKEVDFEALKSEVNEDIYAWIYIPGTKVDYPVLQSPDELDYYLDTNLDGSKGYPGCIYTQLMNEKDWTDKNTVIYGHNMRDGSMFANLHFYEDSDFFAEHPYVYIYAEDKLLAYQVFAAYEYNDRHILLFNDISTEEKYLQYLNGIFENEGLNDNFDTTLDLGAEDCIITLSTCIGSRPTRRWLVQAVLTAVEDLG